MIQSDTRLRETNDHRMDDENYQYAGKLSEFANGDISKCAINGIALCNLEGKLHAVTDFCTHEAVSFTGGYGVLFDGKVICMLHSSVFDIETGKAEDGPAYDPLGVFDVKVEGDDVYVAKEKKTF
jgi:3-phenylpropionate/trans-cinnamate dioxygenase ferredoxin subunit